jgi:hypothetical protein
MSDFKKLLSEAKLPERSVQVCLRPDLAAEYEQAERELEQTQENPVNSLAGDPRVPQLLSRMDGLREEMRGHTRTFLFRALPRRAWRELVAEHPPRQTVEEDGTIGVNQMDRTLGINGETFFDAIIRRCLVSPELDEEDWEVLSDKLTDRQFDLLSDAAWSVNRGEFDIPFSRLASRLSQASATE